MALNLDIAANLRGIPNFSTIVVNPEHLAEILTPYIIVGFTRERLSKDDITNEVMPYDGNVLPVNISEAVRCGMPIFDAIAHFALSADERRQLVPVQALPVGRTNNLMRVAEGLSYLYFFLMTRAQVPVGGVPGGNQDVPNFLRVTLGFNESRDIYVNRLATFPLTKIDHGWIRHVGIPPLPTETRSRLTLGVAGYRMFAPFRYYQVKSDASAEAINAANLVRVYLDQGVSWDIHPLTRNMALLNRAGALNGNLGNLILECFTRENMEDMVRLRMLFQIPVRNPMMIQWRTWNENTFGRIQNVILM